MPIRYAIHPENDLLIYIFEGRFSLVDYMQAYQTIYQDARRHHGMRILMDMRTSEPVYTAQDFDELIALVRQNYQSGFAPDHVTILTPHSSMRFFVDTLSVLADEMPMYLHISHTLQDALRWLKLPVKPGAAPYREIYQLVADEEFIRIH